jgi:Glycosyltransferase sugar-binding region containing DXD motif
MHLFQYWDGAPLPQEVAALTHSYQAHNRHLQYRCYDRGEAGRFIGEHFSARELAAFNRCAVPAMQADYFRYCAVFALGGFYADADTLCVGPVDSMLPAQADAVLFWRGPDQPVVNLLFGFRKPASPLLATVLEIATGHIEAKSGNNVWLATGPGIFSALHEIWRMSPMQRARIPAGVIWGANSRQPGPGGVSEQDVATLIEGCYRTIVSRGEDIEALFRRVAVRRFPAEAPCCKEDIELSYKSTAAHWTHWPGSIYRDG